jgi:hypothetical protein
LSAREYLEKANRFQVKPEELFQYFAIHVSKLTVMYQKSARGKKPLLARSNHPKSKYVVAFTDQDAAKIVNVRQPEYLEMVEEPALPFLLKAYRSNTEGFMFNPGLPSRFFVVRHQLLEWIRHYSLYKFSNQSSAWVIRVGSSILKGVYQSGFSTVVIYTGEHEANKHAEKCGGIATHLEWTKIFQYLERIGSKILFVNYGLPEAFLLNPNQVQVIQDGKRTDYTEATSDEVPIPIPESNQSETAITTDTGKPSREEEASSSTESAWGDWEGTFDEEEPLTLSKDVRNTSYAQTKPSIVESVQKHLPDTDISAQQSKTNIAKEIQNKIPSKDKQVSIEKKTVIPVEKQEILHSTTTQEDKKISPVSQRTFPAFDNPWDEEEDGFKEKIPKPSLFFQSQKKMEAEPVEKLEQKPDNNNSEQESLPKSQEQQVAPSNVINQSDIEHGLRVLEKVSNEGHGMANGWEVCRALADLRRIWVIVDMEGKMVILASQNENQIADFFTSEQYAQTLIEEAHRRNTNLPSMVPRLISTKKLFRALAPTECIIWINRGSQTAWTSILGDTLPYVLQLIAQKE